MGTYESPLFVQCERERVQAHSLHLIVKRVN